MRSASTASVSVERRSPVDGSLLGTFPSASEDEVREAVAAARAAAPAWAARPVAERVRAVERLADVIGRDGVERIGTICADTGKPRFEALMTELLSVPLFVRDYARRAPRVLRSRRAPTSLLFKPRSARVDHLPHGVVAVIAPWNFPLQLALVPTISALLAGNTVVLKPSEVTPLVSRTIEALLREAGLSPELVHVVHGDGETGAALCRAPVDMIFFTGSPATGRRVMAAAAERLVPVELELGGNDPMIVRADAPIERAARAAVWGGMLNAGQMCISVERILVDEAVAPRFRAALLDQVAALRVGGPDEDADVGPIISPAQLHVVERHVADAIERGARLLCGGARMLRAGCFYEPTVLDGVTPDMAIWREETFGPVLALRTFRSDREAIELANDTPYGLTASVFTRDLAAGRRVAAQLRAGHVYVNDVVTPVGDPALPFGGFGRSGFGRYHGDAGLLAFCQTRTLVTHPAWPARDPFWYPYRGKFGPAQRLFHGLVRGSLLAAFRGLLAIRRAEKLLPPGS